MMTANANRRDVGACGARPARVGEQPRTLATHEGRTPCAPTSSECPRATRRAFTKTAALAMLAVPCAMLSACQRGSPLRPSSAATKSAAASAPLAADLQELGVATFGGVALVAQEGQVLLRQGYGLANMELGVPNTPAMKFRIASLSKQFTALAILQLQQRGDLQVKQSVCTYLSGCPNTWQPITLAHLLSHESGLPEDPPDEDTNAAQVESWTVAQWLDHIKPLPLNFAPGTQFQYSNLGYSVLAAVIERLSGQAYDDFVRVNIFNPLGMQDTKPDAAGMAPYPLLKDRASGYTQVNGAWQNTGYLDLKSTQTGYGSLVSTVDDLWRWNQALGTGRLVDTEQLDQMFTPNLDAYGYGWWVDTTPGQRIEYHGGNEPGFDSFSARFPDEKATVIVLCNTEQSLPDGNSAATALAMRLADRLILNPSASPTPASTPKRLWPPHVSGNPLHRH